MELGSCSVFRNLERAAVFKPLDDGLEIGFAKAARVDTADGGADKLARDGVGAFELAFVLEFDLAGDGGKRGVNVGDTRDAVRFTQAGGALFGAADHTFEGGDRQTLADARALVDALVFARLEGDFLDYFAEIGRHIDLVHGVAAGPGFLRSDGHAFFEGRGVMSANLSADAVFERSDDFSARGVVVWIRGENQQNVERQTQRVTLNLNVAFLHDVEQADLDFPGEIGKFVDGEDAAIGAGQEAIVNGEFIGEIAAATRGADGVEVAKNVRDGDVGSGELFDEAIVPRHPGNRRVVAFGGNFLAAGAADGVQGVVIDFAAGNHGNFGIEQADEAAKDAAFGLAAQAQQNKIVARKQRVDDLRNDGVFVAVDAGEKRLVVLDGAQQILANFFFHRARSGSRVEIRDALEAAESARPGMSCGVLRSSGSCHGAPFCALRAQARFLDKASF